MFIKKPCARTVSEACALRSSAPYFLMLANAFAVHNIMQVASRRSVVDTTANKTQLALHAVTDMAPKTVSRSRSVGSGGPVVPGTSAWRAL